mgnify:CR=1 FL=1
MLARLLRRFAPACALAAAVATPAVAGATDGPDVVVVHVDDDDDDDDETEVVETVEVVEDDHHHHHHAEQPWLGFHLGAVNTPMGPNGHVRPGKRVTSNPFKACLDPFSERYCSAMRGFDMRVQYYETTDAWHFPRWVGYFRTGYSAGRAQFDPADREGYATGEATSLAYYAVPLFFGGSVYLFEKFPVRPYGGLGFGFDVVKLQYMRHEDRSIVDASARIGFELHAGLEARISNVVALSAEVQQLWSARRKIDEVPDFSNQGLTIITGIAISIPTRQSRQHHPHGHHHKVVRKVKREPAKAPPVAAPPVVVTPAPAPAPTPVNVEVNQTVNAAPTADATAPVAAPAPAPAPATDAAAAATEAVAEAAEAAADAATAAAQATEAAAATATAAK